MGEAQIQQPPPEPAATPPPTPEPSPAPRRSVAPLVLVPVLLLVIGASIWWVGRNVWAWHHFQAAKNAAAGRRFDEARAHLALYLQVRKKDPEAHFLMARAARRGGDYAAAEEQLGISKELGWVKEAIALEWALLAAQRGDIRSVEGQLLSWVAQDHPEKVLILEALAQGYLKDLELAHAEHCLNLWLEEQPDEAQALFWRGLARESMMRQAAMADFERVLELKEDDDQARLHLANLLLQEQKYGQAAEHFEQLYDRDPASRQALFGLARSHYGQGHVQEARQLLDQLLEAYPNDAEALSTRGQLALEAGQIAEAEEWLRKAVALDPYDDRTLHSYIQCLQQRGKDAQAKEWTARMKQVQVDLVETRKVLSQIAQKPRDPSLRQKAGALFLANGREKEGLQWLDSALQLDPGHPAAHRTLADYFERKGNKAQAAYHRRLAQQGLFP